MPATEDHAHEIGLNLRAQDLLEVSFLCPGADPVDVVRMSWTTSYPSCFTGLWAGEPIIIFGVGPSQDDPRVGNPWLLGKELPQDGKGYLARFTLPWVRWMNDVYPYLWNVCHVENDVSIQYLRFAGFQFDDERVSINGGEFLRFWRTPQ